MKTIEKIEKLLARHAELVKERNRHVAMQNTLKEDEEKLMKKADLNNRKDFDILAAIRLKRDLLPNKIAEFEEAELVCADEIASECADASREACAIIDGKIKELCKRATIALDELGFSLAAAREIVHFHPAGEALQKEYQNIKHLNQWTDQDVPPPIRARRLIPFLQNVENATI